MQYQPCSFSTLSHISGLTQFSSHFLRLSNVLPQTMNSFDLTRQLFFGNWSHSINKVVKTNQERQQVQTMAVPKLGDSPVCPVRALQNMTALLPAHPNDPLFIVYNRDSYAPLIDYAAIKHLKDISKVLYQLSNFSYVQKRWYHLVLSTWSTYPTYHAA